MVVAMTATIKEKNVKIPKRTGCLREEKKIKEEEEEEEDKRVVSGARWQHKYQDDSPYTDRA